MKKILALLLCLALLFTSGCGGSGGIHKDAVDLSGLALEPARQRYSFEFADFPQSMWFGMSSIAAVDGKIFLLGMMGGSYLYSLDTDSLSPVLLASREDESEQWYAYCAMDGRLYVLDSANRRLIEFGTDGERLRAIALPGDLFVSDIASDGEYIYALGSGMVTALRPGADAAEQVFSIGISPYASIADDGAGRVFVAWRDGETQALSEIDAEKQRLGETSYFNTDCAIAGTGRDWDIYLRIGGALYGYRLSDGSMEKLLSFSELGLKSNGVVYELGGGRFLYTGTFGEIASVPVILKPDEGTDGDVTLVLATVGELPYAMEKSVRAWNQLHPECRVEIKDYSAGADERTAQYQLIADIGSGKGPDLYNMSGPLAGRLIRRGLLEDLYPYIDGDPELSRSDFMSGPLSSLEVEGTLPHIAPSFSLLTTFAAKKDVGSLPDISYESLSAVVDGSAYYRSIFDMTYDRDQWLRIMVAASGDKLIDWTERRCGFDSGYFRELLTLAAARTEPEAFYGGGMREIVEASHSVLYTVVLSGIWQAAVADDAYGTGSYVYVGIPEVGNVISPEIDIGMSVQTANKEACWRFIREFLMSGSSCTTEIPLRRDGARRQMEKELENLKQNPSLYDSRTQAMEYLISVIEDADVLYRYDADLWSIIQSEANKFYAGQNTLDEAVRAIQSRAGIYMSEQS